ncbi:N-acyl-D-amino-acid deacylase family protein [Lutimonas sp.]|uniref:N-acyl-D-amino-acid deacylase family protein n=1 Tax=Lutimonas sp. TaxID=1872403 RepID=UPI003D9BC052
MKKCIFLLICFSMVVSYGQQSSADVVIRNGTIIDGLGNPALKADLLIRNGLMELLKPGEQVQTQETIDATGLIIAPGFIDVHNHSDWSLQGEEKKLNEGFIRQGVTTIVGGPDGYWAPSIIKELIEVYDDEGIGTNVAFYVGHNGIRKAVMKKDQNRTPTADELKKMKMLVREGMELGAVGLSTGLMYEPGIYSNTDELIALSEEVALYNGIYDSHVRNPVHAFVKSHREVIEISTSAKIPGKLGHLKAVGLHNEGAIDEIILMVDKYRNDGFTIVSDQYPYDGAQTEKLEQIIRFPSDMEEGRAINKQWNSGNDAEALGLLKLVLTDEVKKAEIKKVSEEGENGGFAWLKATGYSSMRITSSKDYPELVGKYLSEVAEEKHMDPFDALCDLILQATESSFITLGGINEKDVQKLLLQPWNMIASDGSYIKQSNKSSGHPRSTGTFPRVLGHYSRDLKLLTLEEAVRKMTSLPADVIGFKNRGRIQNGLPADIVIFNPETIIDNSTFEQPNLYASGVIHVFVNGVAILQNEEMTGNASGRYLSLIEESKTN